MALTKPFRVCTYPGCTALIRGASRCEQHTHDKKRREEAKENPNLNLINSPEWRELRAVQLHRNPLCKECMSAGKLTPATQVDHIEPHRGRVELFFDEDNLQSLCAPCHSRKTYHEDGGFGNRALSPYASVRDEDINLG